jgi:hypothetical protein
MKEQAPSKDQLVLAVSAAFDALMAGKKSVPTAHGQQLGCEQYSIRFSGAQYSAVVEAIGDLYGAIRNTPEPPAVPAKMRICFQPQGRCLWHEDCTVAGGSGVMQVVTHEESRSLLECGHCKQRGYYPKGAVGSVCVDVDRSAQPPGACRFVSPGVFHCAKGDIHEHTADGVCGVKPALTKPVECRRERGGKSGRQCAFYPDCACGNEDALSAPTPR